MTATPSTPKTALSCPDLAGLAARLLLGGLFLYMGLNKALHPVDFLKLVRQYELFENPYLLNFVAATLPWFELFCGLLLVFGIAVRGSALAVLAMLAPFTVIVINRAIGIAHDQNLPFCAVKFDCGCGTGEILICRKIVENLFLMFLSIWLLLGKGRCLALRFELNPRTDYLPHPPRTPGGHLSPRIIVLLAAAVLVSFAILRGGHKPTKVEAASLNVQDHAAMLAAVHSSRRSTNGLSVYHVEKYTRGKASWYHVLFYDENEKQPGIHPTFDFERTSTGWQVVNKSAE